MEYKKNHYVPIVYLKRWTDPVHWNNQKQKIYSLNLRDKIVRFVPISTQCYKSNLYDTPDDFSIEHKKSIEKAFMGHFDKVFSKIMDRSYDIGKDPSSGDINDLVMFILNQSFRTPKFRDNLITKIKSFKDKFPKLRSTPEEFAYNLVYLIVKIIPEFLNSCFVEILITKPGHWFITSDNPSTYWLFQWQKFTEITSISEYRLHKNLKLLCPINPQICYLIHLNYLKLPGYNIAKRHVSFPFLKRVILRNELSLINSSIIKSADKQIFGLSFDQLDYYSKHLS
jgi:hypothetical protein